MYKYMNLKESEHDCLVETLEGLRRGWLICVPTDTVYGIICAADRPDAVQSLITAKRRPKNKPFALFTDTLDRVEQAGAYSNKNTKKLELAFWPGDLTMVLPARPECPCEYEGSVGVRSPNHTFLQTLIDHYNGLLVNTSLNESGEDPVWELQENSMILAQMDLVIDEGRLEPKPPSTVVDCREEQICILREGTISQTEIEQALQ